MKTHQTETVKLEKSNETECETSAQKTTSAFTIDAILGSEKHRNQPPASNDITPSKKDELFVKRRSSISSDTYTPPCPAHYFPNGTFWSPPDSCHHYYGAMVPTYGYPFCQFPYEVSYVPPLTPPLTAWHCPGQPVYDPCIMNDLATSFPNYVAFPDERNRGVFFHSR